ncbi:D-tyrosyl-tRNA(Tyr) deacylase [bacterium]|nr:D-tyrosyl-tRNA(Tyr) deacylase [bacterium]
MIAVLQRVREAEVRVDGKSIARTGQGLLLLVGIEGKDTDSDAFYLAKKIANLRIFEDKDGKMNLSVLDVGGEILSVSNFTLAGSTKKGRRPSFATAMSPEKAEPLFERFNEYLKMEGIPVKSGIFGAKMEIQLINAGPVTFVLNSQG